MPHTLLDKKNISISLSIVVMISVLLILFPATSKAILQTAYTFLVEKCGIYYRIFGLTILIASLYFAFSRYGKVKLGKLPKPRYSLLKWGAMVFTSTMAADLLYWSFIEWAYYYNDFANNKAVWAATLPLFHWGPIPWSFYLLLAAAFGFMLYSKGRKQKISETCRPVLKHQTDKFPGKLIDIFVIIALIAASATTFSISIPLLNEISCRLFGIPPSNITTLLILISIAVLYTVAVYFDIKGVSKLAKISVLCFTILLISCLLAGPTNFIIRTSIASVSNLLINFLPFATSNTHPWTTFYWAYWLVWCIGTPFFIGKISEGRTIKQVILQGYLFGLAGTFMSFMILGYTGLNLQLNSNMAIAEQLSTGVATSELIMGVVQQLPFPVLFLGLIMICMITLYATTFDALVLVASAYSVKTASINQSNMKIRLFWSLLLIVLPIILIFFGNSLADLQTIAIIAAFPISLIVILIVISFYLDINHKEICKTV